MIVKNTTNSVASTELKAGSLTSTQKSTSRKQTCVLKQVRVKTCEPLICMGHVGDFMELSKTIEVTLFGLLHEPFFVNQKQVAGKYGKGLINNVNNGCVTHAVHHKHTLASVRCLGLN